MRKIFLLLLVFVLSLSIVGCSLNVNLEDNNTNKEVEESLEIVSISGVIENIVIFDSYKELTIKVGNEAKTFWLRNSTHLFDNSYNPKVEPYLSIGTYVDIEVESDEYNKNKPIIKKITITSYDGVFQV